MNDYSTMTEKLTAYLASSLPSLGYAPLTVARGVWKPRALPAFDKFYVQVAPPVGDLWREVRESVLTIRYVLVADVYLLVKNYGEEQSVFGDTAPDLGVFQLISDVKDLLRSTDLDGLLTRSYSETSGPVNFDAGVAGGFDTGPRTWVHRARVPYTAEMKSFCPPRS